MLSAAGLEHLRLSSACAAQELFQLTINYVRAVGVLLAAVDHGQQRGIVTRSTAGRGL